MSEAEQPFQERLEADPALKAETAALMMLRSAYRALRDQHGPDRARARMLEIIPTAIELADAAPGVKFTYTDPG